MNINDIKENPDNPRVIRDERFKKLVKSIRDFPKMLTLRPIVVNDDNVVLGGNMRLRACREAGLTDVPVVKACQLSPEEQREFIIKDNLGYGEWDFNDLKENWDLHLLEEWGLELPDEESKKNVEAAKKSLAEEFIVPPFSVFDTRQDYWRKRLDKWKELGLKEEETRDSIIVQDTSEYEERYGGFSHTSLFDPVLCEIAYRWFCPTGGLVLDPFAGGAVRGVTASILGYRYLGVDIRQDQVTSNENIARATGSTCSWICGDSATCTLPDSVDFVFSCPPYHDLEKYSDLSGDLSNMGYERFIEAYGRIIHRSIGALASNRFACFVVGEIRNKKTGFYRGFVQETVRLFEAAGARFYNDIVMINTAGTLGIRAKKTFTNRKVAKQHQNVLVFYKGDIGSLPEFSIE